MKRIFLVVAMIMSAIASQGQQRQFGAQDLIDGDQMTVTIPKGTKIGPFRSLMTPLTGVKRRGVKIGPCVLYLKKEFAGDLSGKEVTFSVRPEKYSPITWPDTSDAAIARGNSGPRNPYKEGIAILDITGSQEFDGAQCDIDNNSKYPLEGKMSDGSYVTVRRPKKLEAKRPSEKVQSSPESREGSIDSWRAGNQGLL